MLDISGCIVTIDAMGCQKKIVDRRGDYIFGLKGNQGTLNEDVREFFRFAEAEGFKDIPHDYAETVDGEHGRVETRRIWVTSDIDWFQEKGLWKGLASCGAILDALRVLTLVDNTRLTAGKKLLHRVVSMLFKMSA